MGTAVQPDNATTSTTKSAAPIIVDLGKRSRKQIRQMRRGTGKLIDEVQELVDGLRADGTVSAEAQPIVLVVRQRRRRTNALFPFV